MIVIVIKKVKETKKYVIKQRLKFNDYKDSLLNNEIILKSQQNLKLKLVMSILKKSIRLH